MEGVVGGAGVAGDLSRHEYVFVPGASERTLLMLHGTGGDERDLLGLAGRIDPSAAVLSPRGNVLERGMPRFFARLAEGVLDGPDIERRSAELAAWIRAALAHHGRDTGGLVAVGYSNGANMAAAVMLRHPGVVGRAVLLRGMRLPIEGVSGAGRGGAAALLLAGGQDGIAPPSLARGLAEQLRGVGVSAEVEVLEAGHGLSREDVDRARLFVAAGG